MKKVYCIAIILFAFKIGFAQDFIVLKTGEEIKSKVTEITSNEIKYKKFDNLEGPAYSVNKSTVFMIKYKNGTKDIINPINEKQKDVSKENNSNVTDSKYKTKRKPVLSCVYSVLYPGIGQFYNKEYGKGALFMGVYTLEWVVFLVLPLDYVEYTSSYYGTTGYYELSGEHYGVLVVQGIIFLCSAIDAPLSSAKINRKYGFTSNNIFENKKFGLNIEPHTNFALINQKQYPVFGAKLTMNIK